MPEDLVSAEIFLFLYLTENINVIKTSAQLKTQAN
jgi:hypothetical protein